MTRLVEAASWVLMLGMAVNGQCQEQVTNDVTPIRALLITGGCCHTYGYQANKLVQHSIRQARIDWVIQLDPRQGTRGELELYDDPKWAQGYDVVVHNECFADTNDPEYIRKITSAHRAGVPAVVIHVCDAHIPCSGRRRLA